MTGQGFVRWKLGLLLVVCAASASARAANGRLRLTEPRLTGFDVWQQCTDHTPLGHAVAAAVCGIPNLPREFGSIAVGECDRRMKTETDTVVLLANAPQCTDAAVDMLARLARPRMNGRTLSNLAAAYLIRAQRNDRATDLVRGLATAQEAVQRAPQMAEARFNLALAEESLGLSKLAIATWESLRGPAGWGAEASAHWRRLKRAAAVATATEWPSTLKRLPELAARAQRVALKQLVLPASSAAQRYVEEEVLPAWAAATANGEADEAARQLRLAQMIAVALAQGTSDRYLLDSVNVIRATHDPKRRAFLQKGLYAFREARRVERGLVSGKAGDLYEAAEAALTGAECPLRYGARFGRVSAATITGKYDDALALLQPLRSAARRSPYPYLRARIHSSRALIDFVQNRYLDALAEYSAAQRVFEQMHDRENLANVHTRKIGLFRTVGHAELTWREVLQAQRYAPSLYELNSIHLYLGEIALAATELGFPSVALEYQEPLIRRIEDEMQKADDKRLPLLRRQLGIALRARAGIRARQGDSKGAQEDLDRAVPLISETVTAGDANIVTGLRARLAENQALAVASTDRKQAIAFMTSAITLAAQTPYRTLLASFLVQRAKWQRLENEKSGAVHDLLAAVDALGAEEQAMLQGRGRMLSYSERLWPAYFARFQEAYRDLVEQLIETGDDAAAFTYAEKARAFEPLDLVLRREDTPASFRNLVREGVPLSRDAVAKTLPEGTFLCEYAVLDDRTYVWVIGNGDATLRMLPVGEEQIRAWTTALQRFAADRDRERFRDALEAPYKGLLEEPLARIAKLRKPGTHPKVVIVPDRSMHGLPFSALRHRNRFVVEDYAVSVSASATLYAYSLATDRQRSQLAPQSVLLIGNPAFDKRLEIARELKPLTNAAQEVRRIRALYEPRVKTYAPPPAEATVPAFLRLAHESTVIHIAAHGIPNPEAPSRSLLLLAPAEDDRGLLDAETLLARLQSQKTRLAVLSACSSVGGTPVGPEGLAPLVRPLIAAGIPGVAGTLWDVSDDAATEELLVRFHQHYRDGNDADEALRLAQSEMLRDPDRLFSSPIAWAPFQMIGYASSPFPVPVHHNRR